MKRNQVAVMSLAAVLSILVLTFVVLLVAVVGKKEAPSQTRQSSIILPLRSPTPPPLAITPQQGWVAAKTGIPYTLDVSFGVNNPYIGYACGVTSTSEGQASLQLSKTTDGGATWAILPTSALKFASCAVQTNPVDPQAILLTAKACLNACSGAQEAKYYVAHDGGKTWQPLQTPPGENTSVQIVTLQWAGKGLIGRVQHIVQQPDGQRPTYQIVYSTDGLRLNWLDQAAFYDILGSTMRAVDIATFGTTLQVRLVSFAQFPTCQSQNFPCVEVMQSADGGGTWEHFTPTGLIPQENTPQLATPDGKTLYSTTSDRVHAYVVTSTDAGHTWAAIAPALTLDALTLSLLRTPDGTLFVRNYDGRAVKGVRKIWRLGKNGSAWQSLLDDSFADALNDASINLAGHPVALWSVQLRNDGQSSGITTATLAYHAPTP